MSIIKKSLKIVVLAAVAGFSAVNTVKANGWDWTGPYKSRQSQIQTLVIADDGGASRVLADLILGESKQPYIKLPGKANENIAFFGAKQGKGIQILEKDFGRFIQFVSPERILVIAAAGENRDKYVKMLPENKTVVVIYNDENWLKTAETVSTLFNMSHLAKDFKRLYTDVYVNTPYRPTKPKKQKVKVGGQVDTTNTQKTEEKSPTVNKPAATETKNKLETAYVIGN
ncbi:hypothetical protein AAEX28_08990 [Lentisphaerota bacterium WC36G]|nr:hypothetical protein LJT99_11840 [Lentisphaerae bacterium WC36]